MTQHKSRCVEYNKQVNSYRAWKSFYKSINDIEKFAAKTKRNDNFDTDEFHNTLRSHEVSILNSWDKTIRTNTVQRKVLDNLVNNLRIRGSDCVEDISNTRLCCLKRLNIKNKY